MKNRMAAIAFGFLFSASTFASFDDGLKAELRRDFAQAFREWSPLAERGDVRAQYALALMYEEGKGLPKDEAKAIEWFTKAAEQGHLSAQFNLGVRYAYGRGVARDEVRAAMWLQKGAEVENGKGDASAELRKILDRYRQAFNTINSPEAARTFIAKYGAYDPDGLIPKAHDLERRFAQKEAEDLERQRAEAERRRNADARAQNALSQEQKRLTAWRKSIRVESKTNCGPVIEVKGNLIKVYAPVANYSSEHWIEREKLYSPEYGCTWYNGHYTPPELN